MDLIRNVNINVKYQNKSIVHFVLAVYDVKLSTDQGEEGRNDKPALGSDLRDCGEHSLCEGLWLGGRYGDHHQEHQTVGDIKQCITKVTSTTAILMF